MNSLYSVLLKNILLLALVSVSLIFIFTNYIGFKEVNYILGTVGLLYVIAACYEAFMLSRIETNAHRFAYFTDGFLAKRIIKIIVLLTCALFLYYSKSIIKYLTFLCLIIAFTEIIVTIWRYVKKLSFVVLSDYEIMISTNKLNTMKIADIVGIETRHGLTYFVDKADNALTVRTDMMPEKKAFNQELKNWLTKHQLIDKLKEQI